MTRWARIIAIPVALTLTPPALAAGRPRIVGGVEGSLHDEIARQVADRIARPAGLTLDVVASAGSPETLAKLSEGTGTQLAIVQDDAHLALSTAAERGHVSARSLLGPLRLLAPLHSENIYFLVRADAPWNAVGQIEAARINLGPAGSGNAMTATQLYRALFGRPPAESQVSFLPPDAALVRMLTGKTTDVVILVGTAQHRLIADMKPGVRKFIRVLPLDAPGVQLPELPSVYRRTTLSAAEHPNLLESDTAALSIRISLVAEDRGKPEDALWSRLAQSWCRSAEGTLHLQQADERVSPWPAHETFSRELRACRLGVASTPPTCGMDEFVMGLCSR